MPTYISLIKGTEKGMATPKDLPKVVQEIDRLIEKLGGKLLDWNLTMGQYDAVAKVEFPNDCAAATFILTIGKSGNQMTTTMRAFSQTELKHICEKIQ